MAGPSKWGTESVLIYEATRKHTKDTKIDEAISTDAAPTRGGLRQP
jgi:hypothetical protein